MPKQLQRFQDSGDLHFLTFSCQDRKPYLDTAPRIKGTFEESLEMVRRRYVLRVYGYVVMPEHAHLLVSEPMRSTLDVVIQSFKSSVSRQAKERPFWLPRYYDFNVFSEEKRVEKLKYMHRNPVVRGLVARPEDWIWSSYRHYLTGEVGTVEIESEWTAGRREGLNIPTEISDPGSG